MLNKIKEKITNKNIIKKKQQFITPHRMHCKRCGLLKQHNIV